MKLTKKVLRNLQVDAVARGETDLASVCELAMDGDVAALDACREALRVEALQAQLAQVRAALKAVRG